MAPRSFSQTMSTASSSLYTDDASSAIEEIPLDEPAKMSPPAIVAELKFYGVTLPFDANNRDELEKALGSARRGNSSGGLQRQQPQHHQGPADDQQSESSPGPDGHGNPDQHEQHGEPRWPGRAPQHHHHGQALPPYEGGGDNHTRFPLTPNNKIPYPILQIIRTSADPSMKSINLDNRELGDREVIKLSEAMQLNRTITSLSLRNCSITDEGSKGLAKMLLNNKTLVALHLDGNRISTEGAASLSTALITNDTLAVLTLKSNTALSDTGVVYLIGALEHNTALSTLDVHNCGTNNSGRILQIEKIMEDRQMNSSFENLLERLLDDDFRVTGIDLSGLHIGDKGAERLAEALADNTQVRQVWLRDCNIGNGGAKALASCLEQNMAVVDLFLGKNNIGDEGLVAISDALAVNNLTLVSLELDDNEVGKIGLDALASALETNTSVLVASFVNNPIAHGDDSRKVDELLKKLEAKRNELNLVSFVVDPDAASATSTSEGNRSGLVRMSVCSSYMPSTYRRAGFTSQAGAAAYLETPGSRPDARNAIGNSHKYSVYSTAKRQDQGIPRQLPLPPVQQQPRRSRSPRALPKEDNPQPNKTSPRVSPYNSSQPKLNRSSSPKQSFKPMPFSAKQHYPAAAQRAPSKSPPRSISYERASVPIPPTASNLAPVSAKLISSRSSVQRSNSQERKRLLSNAHNGNDRDDSWRKQSRSMTTPPDIPANFVVSQRKIKASESVNQSDTQHKFNITINKLWCRVETMKRANHIAAAHYRSLHFWFWFAPISLSIIMVMVLSLASGIDASGKYKVELAIVTGFFSCAAFVLYVLQSKSRWSSRASTHRFAELELVQVAFRLDMLGQFEGHGLTTGSHTTTARANAIRDLYRIDVYLQAMQQCTPPIPEFIQSIFYLFSSRLQGICLNYPSAVKLRMCYDESSGLGGSSPVPVGMHYDALELLVREIEDYSLYPLFMPKATKVVARTVNRFFANPKEIDDDGDTRQLSFESVA